MGDNPIVGAPLCKLRGDHMACCQDIPRGYLYAWQATLVGRAVAVAEDEVEYRKPIDTNVGD